MYTIEDQIYEAMDKLAELQDDVEQYREKQAYIGISVPLGGGPIAHDLDKVREERNKGYAPGAMMGAGIGAGLGTAAGVGSSYLMRRGALADIANKIPGTKMPGRLGKTLAIGGALGLAGGLAGGAGLGALTGAASRAGKEKERQVQLRMAQRQQLMQQMLARG